MSMVRHFKPLLAVAAAFALLCAAAPARLNAQNPPGDRDLQIYAGLHAAAANGDVAEIERLVAEGENLNLQDSNSRTPLLVATYRRHHKAAEALLRLGANPNARDLQRYDMLTIAVVQNDIEMLKIGLAGGASARNVTGPTDGSALISAAHLGYVEFVKLLIEAKAPLDHVNQMRWTALITAVVLGNGSKEHVATVEALVQAGADTEIKDRRDTTALGHARARGYTDIVKILEIASGRKT
jgi:ankyrin repeat protein